MRHTSRTYRWFKHIARHTLLIATLVAAEPLRLPRQLGDFKVVEDHAVTVEPGNRELFQAYRFIESFGARYADSGRRTIVVEAFRFEDAMGAHAAFLVANPKQGIAPMIWHIEAATGGGVTVLEFHNYLLRFSGAIPTVSSHLEEMLAKLPGLTSDEMPWGLSGRYLDPGSARMVLGPVSLARFESRVPPSAAAFRLGAKGRVASFETPAGRMSTLVFEYPDEAVAKEQLRAMEKLPRTLTRQERTCVGIVLDPIDAVEAEKLLADPFCGPMPISFDLDNGLDEPLTLIGGLGFAIGAFAVGSVIVLVKRATANPGNRPPKVVPRDDEH